MKIIFMKKINTMNTSYELHLLCVSKCHQRKPLYKKIKSLFKDIFTSNKRRICFSRHPFFRICEAYVKNMSWKLKRFYLNNVDI